MPLAAETYVSASTLGDLGACQRELRRLDANLRLRVEAGQLKGYLGRVFESAQ